MSALSTAAARRASPAVAQNLLETVRPASVMSRWWMSLQGEMLRKMAVGVPCPLQPGPLILPSLSSVRWELLSFAEESEGASGEGVTRCHGVYVAVMPHRATAPL